MASGRTDVAKVPLPAHVGAGLVVGRGGNNTRWLHIHSGGAHITVNDLEVVIRAKDAQVRARAVQLVHRQLEAMQQYGIHDSLSPCRLDYVLLESGFGHDPRVRFAPRTDEVAAAVMRRDKLFELVPVPRHSPAVGATVCVGAGGDDDDEPEAPLLAEVACWVVASRVEKGGGAGGSAVHFITFGADDDHPSASPQDLLSPRDQHLELRNSWPAPLPTPPGMEGNSATSLRFHATPNAPSGTASAAGACSTQGPKPLAPAALALAAAARVAAAAAVDGDGGGQQKPGVASLKMRFHLGKHLFRNLGTRAGRDELTVLELEGGGPGRGEFQSVFSNHVTASTVPRVTCWLTEALGFSLVDTKTSASLHVINQELNVHYSISLSMEMGDGSTAMLRKVKAGGWRHHTTALLAAPHQMDLRLRLVTQAEQPGLLYDNDAHSTARRVAAAVRSEGFEGFTRSKRGLPRNRHLEYARRKTKRVYEGIFPPSHQGGCSQRMRVSVTGVQDDKGTHFEISGCLPDLDAALRRTLMASQQRSAPAAAEAEAEAEPACFVPEWRRGRSSGGGGAAAAGPDVSTCFVPEWRRGRSSGGGGAPASASAAAGRRLYDSTCSSPTRTPKAGTATIDPPATPPTATATAATAASPLDADDAQWTVGAMTGLSNFVTALNLHLSLNV